MYVRMYVCTYVCMYVCMYVCVHIQKVDMHIYPQQKLDALSNLCKACGKKACQQTVHYCMSARQLLEAIEDTTQSETRLILGNEC